MRVPFPLDESRLPRHIFHAPINQTRNEVCVRIGIDALPHRSTVMLSFVDKVESSRPHQRHLHIASHRGNGNIPYALLPPKRISSLDEVRTRRLAQAQSQQPWNRIPDKHVSGVEEIAVAQLLESIQCLPRRNESRCRVDGKVLLKLSGRNVKSCLRGLATGNGVCCCSRCQYQYTLRCSGSIVSEN
jgi:hypothetical protein